MNIHITQNHRGFLKAFYAVAFCTALFAFVQLVHAGSLVFGTGAKFANVGSDIVDVAGLSSTNFVVAYSDDSDSDKGKAVVATVASDESITYGTPVAFYGTGAISRVSIASLSSSTIVVSYRSNSDGKLFSVVGTVSGTSITFGTPTEVATTQTYFLQTTKLNATQVLITYNPQVGGGLAYVGTVSGTSISFASAVSINGGNETANIQVARIEDDKVILSYKYLKPKARVGYMSGGVFTLGSETTVVDNQYYNAARIDAFSSTKLLAVYGGSLSYPYGMIGTVSGNSVSFGSTTLIRSIASSGYWSAPMDSTNVAIGFYNYNSPNTAYSMVVTLSGSSLEYGSEVSYSTYPRILRMAQLDSSTVVYAERYYSPAEGYAYVGQMPDTTAPSVSMLSPADGATGVSTTANLVMTFDESIATTGTGTVTIKKTSDDSTVETIAVTGALVTGSGTTAITINPATTLDAGTSYYVQVSADAFPDAAGNYYVGINDTTTWNFTTDSGTPPTISSFVPADNASGVGRSQDLVITFNEIVDGDTGNITLKLTSDDSTVETIAVTDAKVTGSGTTTITINPATTLSADTGYYVQIDSTAFQDTEGTSYAGIADTTTWNFTVSGSTVISAPPGIDVETNPGGTDVTTVPQSGDEDIRVTKTGEGPVVDLNFDFDAGNTDFTDVTADRNDTNRTTLVTNLSDKAGVNGSLTVYVKKDGDDDELRLCSGKTSAGCTSSDSWSALWDDTGALSSSNGGFDASGITVTLETVAGESVWKVSGISNGSLQGSILGGGGGSISVPDMKTYIFAIVLACICLSAYRHHSIRSHID